MSVRLAIKHDNYKHIDMDKLSKQPVFTEILKIIKSLQLQDPLNLLENLRLKRKIRFELN
jgi:hypothetical protein